MNLLRRFNPEKLQHALDVAQIADDAARALGMFVRECGGGENSGLLGKLGPGEDIDNFHFPARSYRTVQFQQVDLGALRRCRSPGNVKAQ
jgi:hypothetical protein